MKSPDASTGGVGVALKAKHCDHDMAETATRAACATAAAAAEIPELLRQIEAEKVKEQLGLRQKHGLLCEYDVRLWHLRNVWKGLSNKVKRVPAPTSNIDLVSMRNAKHKQYQQLVQTQCEVKELRAKNRSLQPLLRGLRCQLMASIAQYQCLEIQLELPPETDEHAHPSGSKPRMQDVLRQNRALGQKVKFLRNLLHKEKAAVQKMKKTD